MCRDPGKESHGVGHCQAIVERGFRGHPRHRCAGLPKPGGVLRHRRVQGSPHRVFSLILKHAVTHFGASPTLIRMLASHGPPPDAPRSLRVRMAAGEVLDSEHFEWYFRHLGRGTLPVINYTGGTEAWGALLSNVVVRPIKASAFNSESPGVSVHAVDDQGHRVRGVVGEMAVTAPFVGMTRSFWNDEARYLESYWLQWPGTWMHGDLSMEDADGHFHILGRADDTLKIAGKRVGPAEVEAVVLAFPWMSAP